jgi:NADH dehydrogenase
MNSRIRLVVIGGGIAGAELVRTASPKKALDITLIEPKPRLEVQALYPEYLVGKAKLEDMIAPLYPFCQRVGASFINERALNLRDGRVICTRREVEYDVLVIAVGTQQDYFGIEGAELAFSINTLDETISARQFIERKGPERIMVIGSGLTGVETASVLADSLAASVYLIEAKDRVLPQFPPGVSSEVQKWLSSKGVKLLTSSTVSKVGHEMVTFFDGTSMDCDMAIWTTGIKPPELVESLDLPKHLGWLQTDPYLRVRDDIFALGDNAWIEVNGRVATKTGLEAERQARHMCQNLTRMVDELPLNPYNVLASTDTPIALISTGSSCAVGVYGGLCLAMPSRLLHALKMWIDKSIANRYK